MAGPLVFLSSGDRYVGELLELHQGCHGPFQDSRVKVGFLSRCHSGKGPHLALRGESPGFSRVVAGNLRFLSSYDGDLRDPLVLPQESQFSMRVARGLSRFVSSQRRGLCHHLELSPETQCSSPVLTWISGFLWSFNRGVRPCLLRRHRSPLSSRAAKVVSGLLTLSSPFPSSHSPCRPVFSPHSFLGQPCIESCFWKVPGHKLHVIPPQG